MEMDKSNRKKFIVDLSDEADTVSGLLWQV